MLYVICFDKNNIEKHHVNQCMMPAMSDLTASNPNPNPVPSSDQKLGSGKPGIYSVHMGVFLSIQISYSLVLCVHECCRL